MYFSAFSYFRSESANGCSSRKQLFSGFQVPGPLPLCQALAIQGQEFTFSVTIRSSFSFSWNTRESSKEVHQSPSNWEEVKPLNVKGERNAQPPAAFPVPNDPSNSSTICSAQAESNCQTGTWEYPADYGDPLQVMHLHLQPVTAAKDQLNGD